MNEKKSRLGWLIWSALPKSVSFCLIATCALTVGLVGASVAMRYVLRIDLFGVEELITVVTMWLYFLGSIYGSYEESHIKGDLLEMFFKTGFQKKLHRIYVYGYSTLILAVWSVWGYAYMLRCLKSSQVTPGWHIPLWVSQLAIPIGIFGMLIYSACHLYRAFKGSPGAGGDGQS